MFDIPFRAKNRVPSLVSGILRSFALPMPVAMLLIAVLLGLIAGMPSDRMIATIGAGFGASLGGFALILIPSFTLAAAMAQAGNAVGTPGLATVLAPLTGAMMVCPDTGYATLSSVAGHRKLSVALGTFAGFKLLVPAGPAIVATALGGLTPKLAAAGAVIFIPCWIVGLAYARLIENPGRPEGGKEWSFKLPAALAVPLGAMIVLIAAGGIFGKALGEQPLLGFAINPKGALLIAAFLALCFLDPDSRVQAIESGVRRTAPLLLVIGAASAFGLMLAEVVPLDRLARWLVETGLVLPSLFLLAALFKVSKGSSMATFAGTVGIVAPLMPTLGISPEAATLALCAGAFVTVLPNDSFYWLVARDAFTDDEGGRAARVLAIGPALQGLTALIALQLAVSFGWL